MPQRHDSINSMSPADKLLRVGTFGGFALLLLLVTVRSFSDGPGPQDAPQVAEASQEAPDQTAEESSATEMADAAPQQEATEEPADIAEAPEAEEVPEVEVAEAEVETADAAPDAETTEAAPEAESAEPEATAEAVEETEMAAEADAAAPEPEAAESGTVAEAEVAQADAASADAATSEADASAADPIAESTFLASADIESGESAFRQCSACHQYENERNGAGPHLVGIVGRDIGAVDDWRYSDALLDAEGVWTPERLNAWLTNPDDYLPGNRMIYPGVRSEQDRIDIIGFLAAQAQD